MFPVRRIYCIGRNYAAHAREMGSDPNREPPFFFQKPTDAIQLAPPGETIDHPYPTLTKNYHYEVELVAALGKGGRDVPIERALDLVLAYTVGLDMTRRDLQRAMGDEKKPWEIGKSFDHSAVLGPLQPAAKTGHFTQGTIWLKVNGATKQNANLNQMIWNVAEQVSNLSKAFELMPGDIIYSGTPENVGPVVKGDIMDAHIDGLPGPSRQGRLTLARCGARIVLTLATPFAIDCVTIPTAPQPAVGAGRHCPALSNAFRRRGHFDAPFAATPSPFHRRRRRGSSRCRRWPPRRTSRSPSPPTSRRWIRISSTSSRTTTSPSTSSTSSCRWTPTRR